MNKNFIKLNQSGQVFSLDAIIALTVLFFAVALLANSIEASQYSVNEDLRFNQLKEKAVLSLISLTSSNDFSCTVNLNPSYNFNSDLLNCIEQSKFDLLTKHNLGISSDFDCFISLNGSTALSSECSSVPPAGSVVSLNQNVLISNSSLTKQNWNECIYSSSCSLQPAELIVKVWYS